MTVHLGSLVSAKKKKKKKLNKFRNPFINVQVKSQTVSVAMTATPNGSTSLATSVPESGIWNLTPAYC